MLRKTYETVEMFEEDLKWFAHNCRVIIPQEGETTKELIESVVEQTLLIQECDKCYDNLFDCFTSGAVKKQCTKNHLAVWIRSERYGCYWPTKIIVVNVQEETMLVQFFGDYSITRVNINTDCFIYSIEEPEENIVDYEPLYLQARKVSIKYWSFLHLMALFSRVCQCQIRKSIRDMWRLDMKFDS